MANRRQFLFVFHDKPDSDECGDELEKERFCMLKMKPVREPVMDWEEVEDAVSQYVDREYGNMDYPESPLECWVWEAREVAAARELVVNVERTISVTSSFVRSGGD